MLVPLNLKSSQAPNLVSFPFFFFHSNHHRHHGHLHPKVQGPVQDKNAEPLG